MVPVSSLLLEPTSRKPSDLTVDSNITRSLLQSKVILKIAGDWSAGATPVPIPNTVVKPCSADGTPFERTRESRPSPASQRKPVVHCTTGFSLSPSLESNFYCGEEVFPIPSQAARWG